MTSLVTGASGFIGSHLVDYLLARGDSVIALQRKSQGAAAFLPPKGDRNVAPPCLRIVAGDVLDAALLNSVIVETKPDEIYHLAAQSLPNVSWEQPWLTHRINVNGTLNVLEAVRAAKILPSIVIASSSSVYAQSETPIREDDLCRPASPYGVSKLAADHLGRLYAQRHALRVMCARPFFVIGPRKTGDVSSDWARNIVAIERGQANETVIGNLDIVRDFLHIADGVAALTLIAAKGGAGDSYNISSGRGWNLADVLKALTGMTKTKVVVHVDPARVRPVDERVKIGDNAKLKSLVWREERSVEQALAEILDYWREQT